MRSVGRIKPEDFVKAQRCAEDLIGASAVIQKPLQGRVSLATRRAREIALLDLRELRDVLVILRIALNDLWKHKTAKRAKAGARHTTTPSGKLAWNRIHRQSHGLTVEQIEELQTQMFDLLLRVQAEIERVEDLG